MTYDLRGFKEWKTSRGGGWETTLLKNGKAIATVVNEGNGGAFVFWWRDSTPARVSARSPLGDAVEYDGVVEEAALWEHVKTLPTFHDFGLQVARDPDIFLEELVNDFLLKRTLKRWLKNPVALVGTELLRWRMPVHPDSGKVVKALHPTAIYLNDLPFEEALRLVKARQ